MGGLLIGYARVSTDGKTSPLSVPRSPNWASRQSASTSTTA